RVCQAHSRPRATALARREAAERAQAGRTGTSGTVSQSARGLSGRSTASRLGGSAVSTGGSGANFSRETCGLSCPLRGRGMVSVMMWVLRLFVRVAGARGGRSCLAAVRPPRGATWCGGRPRGPAPCGDLLGALLQPLGALAAGLAALDLDSDGDDLGQLAPGVRVVVRGGHGQRASGLGMARQVVAWVLASLRDSRGCRSW